MRADARRNRARLLAVAEEVFAANGPGASTEEVARAAGVGIGTVFRHFPTKEALLEAALQRHFDTMAHRARALAGAADPGAALDQFFTQVVDHAASKNAFADALSEAGVNVADAAAEVGKELRQALGALLERARDAGAVRADVGVPELIALMVGTSRAVEHARADRPAQQRIISVVLAGLRRE